MNKENVLKKARDHDNRKLGEYEDSIYRTGTRLSFVFMIIVSAILMLIKIQYNQSHYDILCVSSIGIAISNLFIGYKLKNKNNIFSGICWLFISIFSFYIYYQSLLG